MPIVEVTFAHRHVVDVHEHRNLENTVLSLIHTRTHNTDPPTYTFELVYEGIEGQSLLITLGLEGNTLDFPSPDTFQWSFNGQALSGSSDIILTENTIEFLTLDRTNSGNYTVVATNSAGSGSATFSVVVFCEFSIMHT